MLTHLQENKRQAKTGQLISQFHCTNTILTCISQLFNKKLPGRLLKPMYHEKNNNWNFSLQNNLHVPFFLEISLLEEEKIPHLQPFKIRVATVGESNCVTTLTTSCKGDKMLNYW